MRRVAIGRAEARAGFTLMEVVLALAIIALLAALGLPFLRPNTGLRALRMAAFETTALLRSERNAALRSGNPRAILINVETRSILSTTTNARIDLPSAMSLRLLPEGSAGVQFFPDGHASGARLLIASGENIVSVDINGLTAAVNPAGGPR